MKTILATKIFKKLKLIAVELLKAFITNKSLTLMTLKMSAF